MPLMNYQGLLAEMKKMQEKWWVRVLVREECDCDMIEPLPSHTHTQIHMRQKHRNELFSLGEALCIHLGMGKGDHFPYTDPEISLQDVLLVSVFLEQTSVEWMPLFTRIRTDLFQVLNITEEEIREMAVTSQ